MRRGLFLSGLSLSLLAIDILLAASSFLITDSWAWSNGGYSSDPANPDYGTHVLHTLYQASIPDEAYIAVPHYSQIESYYCGPAALEMVFDYYGSDIPQTEIADVANTAPSGTYTTDMVRATHFSNLSTSVGAEMPESITGYTARTFGYAALEHSGTTIDELKSLIAAGYPTIVLTTWHFRVAVGYNSTHITFQDSWYGSMYNMTYAAFDDDWDYSYHWALLVAPWQIEVSTPASIFQGSVFNVTASITYPAPYPFSINEYPASLSNATVMLPSGLNLAPSEVSRKTVDTGTFASGDAATVKWAVTAEEVGTYIVAVEALGKVNGLVPYSYVDRIGEVSQTTIEVLLDEVPPITVDDYDDSWHTADFTITLTASDTISGVADTYYKLNDGPTKTVLVDGHPSITIEAANNKLEYWSVDNAGNEETHHILTGIKLDKTAPTGSITINRGETYTTSSSVTLESTAEDTTSGVYQVRYSNEGIWDTETWGTPSTTKTWTLPTGDGTKTVYYQIKDNAGLISATYSDTIILDATPPTGLVAINEDATYTTTTTVTLTLTSEDETSGVAQMRFSHDEATWTPWEAYSTTETWALTTEDGVKTVYCQIKDNAGLISLTYSDTITLDTASPTVSVTSPTAGYETKSSTLTITWSGSDETSGISHYEIRFDDAPWSDVGTDVAYTLTGLAEGTHTFYVKATDSAGHEKQISIAFVVNTSPLLGPGYMEEAGIAAAVVIVTFGIIAYVMRKRRKK